MLQQLIQVQKTRCTDVTLNKPPQRRTIMPISYSAVVQKVTTRNSKQSQNLDATTAASTISGTSGTFPVFEVIDELKRKLAEIDVERNRYSSQHQKVEDDVSTLTQSMHKMASDIIDIRKDMHGLGTKMKEITDILKKQFNMKQADKNMIISPPRKRRTGKKETGSVSSNEETRLTWASDCDSDIPTASDTNHPWCPVCANFQSDIVIEQSFVLQIGDPSLTLRT
jgi:hypothetical protein